jgi:CBS domain-containing protein
MKLVRRGIRLRGGREETVMTTFRVRDVMTTNPPTVRQGTPLSAVVSHFLEAPITALYVVDAQQRLVGVVSLHDIKDLLSERSVDDLVLAHDLMVRPVSVACDDRLAECMARFTEAGNEALPVVADESWRRLVGRISRRDLVDLYDREVLRRELLGTVAASDPEQLRATALPAGHRLRSVPVPGAWVGETLRHIDLRRATGVTVISIQRVADGMAATTPDPGRPLEAGDVLVVLGNRTASAALDALVARTEAPAREKASGPAADQ